MAQESTDFVEVLRTNSIASMTIVKAMLEGAEIPCFVHDEYSGLVGTGQGYVVKVSREHAEVAKAILADLDSTLPNAEM